MALVADHRYAVSSGRGSPFHSLSPMSMSPRFLFWVFVTLAIFITGCVAIPIPDAKEAIASDLAVAQVQVRSMVSSGDDLDDVKTRLGDPVVDFGPRRVFVYKWTVAKGKIAWFLVGAPAGGIEPVAESQLLFIAFDPDGKVLKTGTKNFKPFDSIAEQLREWLSSNGLAARVVSPRLEQSMDRGPVLFVYRPSDSPCSFPTFDTSIFKPSVSVDGIVVGDLERGEYLASEMVVGPHEITIDPTPDYRTTDIENNYFVRDVRKHRISATLHVSGDSDRHVFVETYLCAGMGKAEMHAVIRDAPSALQVIRTFQSAW